MFQGSVEIISSDEDLAKAIDDITILLEDIQQGRYRENEPMCECPLCDAREEVIKILLLFLSQMRKEHSRASDVKIDVKPYLN